MSLLQTIKTVFAATAIAAAGVLCSSANAAGEFSSMVQGSNNGVATPYNETCLDVAYKNAYKNEKGEEVTSEDYKNFKCYKNGVEVYCNEIAEDGQTEKAKEDIFAEGLDEGNVCVALPPSGKVYEGTPGDCTGVAEQIAVCVEQGRGGDNCPITGVRCYTDRHARDCPNCNDPKTTGCTYGGTLNAATLECTCLPEPNCNGTGSKCAYGGTAVGGGTQNCNCFPPPEDCVEQCMNKGQPYGGVPAANGTQACSCLEAPNCAAKCLTQGKVYGGTPVGNGTQDCTCSEAPNCVEVCNAQGKPWGGTAEGNGTQNCNCSSKPDCTYGAVGNGTQDCMDAPTDCPERCLQLGSEYGGTATGDGSQGCTCLAKPSCDCGAAGGGTQNCVACPTNCECGAKKDGTTACNVCPTDCDCGAKKNGTMQCNSCPTDCPYGAKRDGTMGCKDAPNCNTTSTCTYGGYASANSYSLTVKSGIDGASAIGCRFHDGNASYVCPANSPIKTLQYNPADNTTLIDVYLTSDLAAAFPNCDATEATVCTSSQGFTITLNGKTVTFHDYKYQKATYQSGHIWFQALSGNVFNLVAGQNVIYTTSYSGKTTVGYCGCSPAPDCSKGCTYGGSAKANGTQECNCSNAPSCTCGAKKNGTTACNTCPTEAQCRTTCKNQGKIYGGRPLNNGTTNCDCFTAPNCNQASKCTYGGRPQTY